MMKKLAAIGSAISYLILTTAVSAVSDQNDQINLNRPTTTEGNPLGFSNFADFLNKSITLVFIVAIIAVFIMMVIGAVRWIFSGGNKESVASARGMIINALIGLAILAAAFAIFQLVGTFLGFNIGPGGVNFKIPSPAQ